MKAFPAVVLLASLGLLPEANLDHLKPREAVMPVNPKCTAQEWQNIYAAPKPSPEYSPNFNQDTESQQEYAGKVDLLLDDDLQTVIGGITAYRGQFPWQVALIIDNVNFCGGSLISSQWVLTAAHCVCIPECSSGNNYLVALGTNIFAGTDDGSLVLNATTTVVHELFNSSTINNDIALIQLPTPVEFTTYIQPIRLRYIEEDLTGKFLRFIGWGQTSEHGSGSLDLMYAYVTVITNTECANVYGSIITPTKICTSDYEDMSACSGDKGGPLVYLEIDCVYTQVGIGTVLAVVGCELEYPAGFTRVTSYLSWISAKTGIAIVG